MDSTTASRMLVNTPFSLSLSSFAISFWATSGTDWDNWISFGGTDNFYLQEYAGGGSLFMHNAGGIAGYASYDISVAIGSGLQHMVLSADANAGTASFYINNVLVDTGAWTVSASETLGYLTVGGARSREGTARNIDATIDDVQVYDSALSVADVSLLYANPGSAIPEPATMAFAGVFGIGVLAVRRIFMM